jgi:hypothetical protein
MEMPVRTTAKKYVATRSSQENAMLDTEQAFDLFGEFFYLRDGGVFSR